MRSLNLTVSVIWWFDNLQLVVNRSIQSFYLLDLLFALFSKLLHLILMIRHTTVEINGFFTHFFLLFFPSTKSLRPSLQVGLSLKKWIWCISDEIVVHLDKMKSQDQQHGVNIRERILSSFESWSSSGSAGQHSTRSLSDHCTLWSSLKILFVKRATKCNRSKRWQEVHPLTMEFHKFSKREEQRNS